MLQLSQLLLLSLIFVSTSIGQTKDPISQYLGKWRWVGDMGDTFTIVLKTNRISVDNSSGNKQPRIIGAHSYVENGIIMESNLHLLSDTLNNNSTIAADFSEIMDFESSTNGDRLVGKSHGFDTSALVISFREIARKDMIYTGTMQLIRGNETKAIWEFFWDRPHIYFSNQPTIGKKRLIPNNIVLEKVTNN